jgi:hypothetical protein
MKLKLAKYFELYFCFLLPLETYTNLMATKFSLIIKELSKSVNVNVSFFKTSPRAPFPPYSLYKNVKFITYINVHMFTRHHKPPILLTCDTLPLTKSNVHANVHMFTHVHK